MALKAADSLSCENSFICRGQASVFTNRVEVSSYTKRRLYPGIIDQGNDSTGLQLCWDRDPEWDIHMWTLVKVKISLQNFRIR